MHGPLLLVTGALLLAAQSPPPSPRAAEPITIGQTTSMRSEVLGEERRLDVWLPAGYADSSDRYPVIYLLDGPGHFHHVTGSVSVLSRNGAIPPCIVIGVGNTDRMRDMTPTPDPRAPASGGGPAFLRFLREELIPHVESGYRTFPHRTLIGHSLAGLFTVHAFTAAPDTFQAFVALSPTLEWGEEICHANAEKLFGERPQLESSLFLAMGDEAGRMLDSFDLFLSMLKAKAPPGLRWSHLFLEGDDHGTMVVRGAYHGLMASFGGYRIPGQVFDTVDVVALKRHMSKCEARFGSPPRLPEMLMNNLGYAALGQGMFDDAIALLQMNVRNYPESANVYDSLGEAYEKAGKLDLARENYARAVERGRATSDENLPLFVSNLERVRKALEKS